MPGEFRRRELIDNKFVVTFTIDDSHEGCRADNYLKEKYRHFSRNRLQNLIDEGRILIEGSTPEREGMAPKASRRLKVGDRIKVVTERTEEPPVELEYGTLFEDDHILVIDKPGNLPVHPAGKFLFNTLLMSLRHKKGRSYHLIHRLDRETSGVLLLAKDPETAAHLVREFRERRTEKRYWAVCEGHPTDDEFDVDADIGSAIDSEIRLKMQAFPKGTNEWDALTRFRVLKRSPRGVSLIDCKLETGRQHQIRVHLAHVGHPVVGDKLYGAGDAAFLDHINRTRWLRDGEAITRQALHSRYLKFYYEREKRWLEIESPLPSDLKLLLGDDE